VNVCFGASRVMPWPLPYLPKGGNEAASNLAAGGPLRPRCEGPRGLRNDAETEAPMACRRGGVADLTRTGQSFPGSQGTGPIVAESCRRGTCEKPRERCVPVCQTATGAPST